MLAVGAFGYLGDYLLWWALLLSLLVHTWCFFRFFPRRQWRAVGLIGGNSLIFLCLLGVVAMAGESYYRFIAVETDAFGMTLPARRWFALYTKLNSLDCRDHEWAINKPDGTYRIAFVGDSFTYGWGIEHVEDRFSNRIQAMFDRAGDRSVEVLNVAKPGWDTGAQIVPIQDLTTRYGVDEVVLCYVANDIEKLLPTTPEFNPVRPPFPEFLSPDASVLWEYLYYRIWVPRVATVRGYHDWLAAGFADEDTWRRHEWQLNEIIRHCGRNGIHFRVVLLPFLREGGRNFKPGTLYNQVQRFFERKGVEVLNLFPVIEGLDPNDLVVNSHDAHPNERANRLFADAIWRAFYEHTDRTKGIRKIQD